MEANENGPALVSAHDGTELLLFYLGDECFGIDILKVKEVIPRPPLTQVPHSNSAVSGVFHLRGAPVTVVDLNLAIAGSQGVSEAGSVIITEYLGGRQGVLVSSVDRIIYSRPDDFSAAPPGTGNSHFIDKVVRVDQALIQVLDMEKVLAQVMPAAAGIAEVA
ncbi:MAG: chemotaxis protein CheW [Pseudomonadota bacterium]